MEKSFSDKLSIENLLRAAFERTKDRFLPYLLTVLLYIAMTIGAVIAMVLIGGLNFLIYTATQSVPVTATTAIISGVAAIIGFMYLGSWGSLAMVEVIISPEKRGVMEVYQAVRPLIWKYVIFSILMSLFIIGLFPISIPTLLILLMVWGIWGCFSIFEFLEKKESGLRPLWSSKAIVSKHFWSIFLRIAVVYIAVWIVSGILGAASDENGFATILTMIFSFVVTPFVTSYAYQLYKNVPQATEIGSQKVWIVISIIGWALLFLFAISFSQTLANFKDNLPVQEIMEKQMQNRIDSI